MEEATAPVLFVPGVWVRVFDFATSRTLILPAAISDHTLQSRHKLYQAGGFSQLISPCARLI